ncbi:MAG: IclR family transcriptional regulator [Verrucomicrobiota bacterium]
MQRAATLDKGLDILEAIGGSREGGLGIRDLARRLNINPTSVHNLVWTLCARGYLRQIEATRRFELGPAGLRLVGGPLPWRELAQVAEPLVCQCQRELDESVMLAALHGTEILSLVYVPSSQALRVHEPDVMAERAYGTAVGKMLLSTLSENELETYFAVHPPHPFTPQTLATPAVIRSALAQIRRDGFAETHDELTTGVSAVAVLVESGPGIRVVTGLGASAPTIRFGPRQARKTLKMLQRYARLVCSAWALSRQPHRP